MKVKDSFGNWLKQRRKTLDLTQFELADQVGCSVVTIRKIEADERRPSKQITERLADVLAVSLEERSDFVVFARRTAVSPSELPLHKPVTPTATHNLPLQPTLFIGRTDELAQIAQRLADPNCRLLTLVGAGGIGKTRLALHAAAEQFANFASGVYFVSLTGVGAPNLVASAIAGALEMSFYGPEDPTVQIVKYLRGKAMLLVLDNFEHLLEATSLLTDILAAAPAVKLLTTSRERLNLQEEWVFAVEGLLFPEDEPADPLESYSAVQLFLQRAQQVQANFAINQNAESVLSICRYVEGMPLGIELAAAWLRVMPCQQIAAQIAHSLDFLTTPLRNVPERHRSIRVVFDHSWKLLTAVEQAVFRKLAVFVGGFEPQAAEQVAGASLYTLAALVNKSLVQMTAAGRYNLHELVRQYSEEQLEAAGEADATRHDHCYYYANFMCRREAEVKGRQQLTAMAEIDANFDNVLAACSWMITHQDFDAINLIVETLYRYGVDHNHAVEIIEFWRRAQEQLAPRPPEDRHPGWGRFLARAAHVLNWGTQTADVWSENAHKYAEQALEIARIYGDMAEIGYSLKALGFVSFYKGDTTAAQACFEESLTYYGQLNDRSYRAFYLAEAFSWIGSCREALGYLDDSIRYRQQSLELSREIGDVIHPAWILYGLARPALVSGRITEAEQFLRESQLLHQLVGNPTGYATSEVWLGFIALLKGDGEQARSRAEAALKVANTHNYRPVKKYALAVMGAAACVKDDYTGGKRLCEEAERSTNEPDDPPIALWGLSLANCGLGDYGAARQHLEALQRWGVTHRSALILSLSLPLQAVILAHEGPKERAVELLALAFSYPPDMMGWMKAWPLLTRLHADLEAELGEEGFAAAWAEGKTMTLEQAIAYALEKPGDGT
ncbi:MAG: helix-turn-helix domain-containing protein [Aggregatilineales bacterium]